MMPLAILLAVSGSAGPFTGSYSQRVKSHDKALILLLRASQNCSTWLTHSSCALGSGIQAGCCTPDGCASGVMGVTGAAGPACAGGPMSARGPVATRAG